MKTTSENIKNSKPKYTTKVGHITGIDTSGMEVDEDVYLDPDKTGGLISFSQIADKVAKLALKKLMWYIAKYLLIGAVIAALGLLLILIF